MEFVREYMWILIVVCIVLSCYAQLRVTLSYNRNSKILAQSGMLAKDLARKLLDQAGLKDIQVVRVKGTMTDYYNNKQKIVALSDGVYESSAVSALAICAHEVGHALQYQSGYVPIKIRNFFIKVNNITSILMWPLLILGVILEAVLMMTSNVGLYMIIIVLGIYVLATIISCVTLPVETNASRRAMEALTDSGALKDDELPYAKDMLKAAAFTYLASLIISIIQLLRILALFSRKK